MLPPVRRIYSTYSSCFLQTYIPGESPLARLSFYLAGQGEAQTRADSKVQISKNCPISQAFVLPTQTLPGRIRKEPLGARRVQQVHYTDN